MVREASDAFDISHCISQTSTVTETHSLTLSGPAVVGEGLAVALSQADQPSHDFYSSGVSSISFQNFVEF